jgi:hypothetical protein
VAQARTHVVVPLHELQDGRKARFPDRTEHIDDSKDDLNVTVLSHHGEQTDVRRREAQRASCGFAAEATVVRLAQAVRVEMSVSFDGRTERGVAGSLWGQHARRNRGAAEREGQ